MLGGHEHRHSSEEGTSTDTAARRARAQTQQRGGHEHRHGREEAPRHPFSRRYAASPSRGSLPGEAPSNLKAMLGYMAHPRRCVCDARTRCRRRGSVARSRRRLLMAGRSSARTPAVGSCISGMAGICSRHVGLALGNSCSYTGGGRLGFFACQIASEAIAAC